MVLIIEIEKLLTFQSILLPSLWSNGAKTGKKIDVEEGAYSYKFVFNQHSVNIIGICGWLGQGCGIRWSSAECIWSFCNKTQIKESTWKTSVFERIILKWI